MDVARFGLLLAGRLPNDRTDGPTAEDSAAADGVGCAIAIAINVVSSAMTVAGFVLQKKANDSPGGWKVGDIVLSFKWLVGFFVGIVLPIPAQVLAYSLAPMSLLTPLSGVSVALNMVLAPRLLGERVQRWPDVPASISILLGTLLTTLAGPRHDKSFTFGELMSLLGRAAFVWALVALVLTVGTCISFMKRRRTQIEESAQARPTNPNIVEVMLPALVAACCGCLSNISLKASGELMKGGAEFLNCLVWLLSAGMSALVQLNYVNRGLRLYLQTVFFPVYSALLVVTNTFYGLIFYNEYDDLIAQAGRTFVFSLGIGCIVLGIFMFRLRRSESEEVRSMNQQLTSAAAAVDTELGSRRGWTRTPICSPMRDPVVGVVDSAGQEVSSCTTYIEPQGWRSIVD